jgi:hypothetical protein
MPRRQRSDGLAGIVVKPELELAVVALMRRFTA